MYHRVFINLRDCDFKYGYITLSFSKNDDIDSLGKDISGKNNLDVVKKIESMNKDLKSLTKAYASALAKQIAQTEQAVNAIKDADKKLSSSIKAK
ncbi:YwqI/YxiC family protein [Bacillus paralicheniformis]|nr:YwqI/YxiC family protein [Bacillus paralicheniformis]